MEGLARTSPQGTGANDTLTHTVTNYYIGGEWHRLANNSAYQFQVRARNASGPGTPSVVVEATPVNAVPEAPTDFRAYGYGGQARLFWTYSPSVRHYVKKWQYSSDGGTTWADIPGTNSNSRSGDVTKLSSSPAVTLPNGKTYSFKVRGFNDMGGGAPSAAISVTLIPLAPATFTVTAGDAEAALAWTKSGADATVTGWQYRYKAAGDYGKWTTVPGSASSTTAYTVAGLDNGTVYTFQLRAVNAAGAGPASAEQSATPTLSAPLKPTGLQAYVGDRSVTLQWDDPSNGSITGWQYKQDGGNWKAMTCVSPCVPATLTMYTVTGSDQRTSYSFKIRAVNSTGNSPESDSASATPLAVPGQPTDLTARGDDRQAALSWKAPSGSTVTGWQFRLNPRGNSWGGWRDVTPGAGANDTLTHTVTGTGYLINGQPERLQNNSTYRFQVRALNATGAGTPSAVARAIPVGAAPSVPTDVSAGGGDGQVRLSWAYSPPVWYFVNHWEYSSDDGATWNKIPANSSGYRECRLGSDNVVRCTHHATPALGGNQHSRYAVVPAANGKVHTFKMRGVNDKGGGTPSASASATTLPLAPASFTAAPGDTLVALNWTKNVADATVTGWQYRYKSGGDYGKWTRVPGSSGSTSAYTVTGLDNGTAYTFQVRAANSTGVGPPSAERSATPKIQLPDKPAGLAAAIGDTEVLLTWDDPDNDRITKWRYSKDDGATWTDVPCDSPCDPAALTTYKATGLTNNTAYTFRVRAVTLAGEGPQSDGVTATPKPVPSPPGSPGGSPGNSGEIVLTWTANANAIGWQYRYKSTGDYGDWIDIPCDSPCDPGTLATYTVTGLDNSVEYTFQVRAQNNIGRGLPSTIIVRPVAGAPDKPTGLSAQGGDGQVALSWNSGGSVWVDSWQYSKDGGTTWTDVPDSDRATRGYTVPSLTNGTSYTFKVRAVNEKGEGTASDPVTEPTLPLIPNTFTADGRNGLAALTWTKSSADATVTGWQYRYKSAGDYGDWATVSGGNATTTTVAGLDNGLTYTFQLRALNAAGGGAAKTASDFTTPAKPTGLAATPGFERVTLRWTNPVGGGGVSGNGYRYKPKSGTESGYTDWTTISGGGKTSHQVTGADQRRPLYLPGAGAERFGLGHAVRRSVRVDVPGRPGQSVGNARQRAGIPDLGRPQQRQHHGIPVPAQDHRELWLLDGHVQQRRDHDSAPGDGPGQRHGLHLPRACGERGQRHDLGGGDGHAAGAARAARRRQRPRGGRIFGNAHVGLVSERREPHRQVPGPIQGRQRRLERVGERGEDAAELQRDVRSDQGHGVHLRGTGP